MKRRFKTIGKGGVISAINQNNILIFIVFTFLLGMLTGVLSFKLKSADGNYYKTEFLAFYSGLTGGILNVMFCSLKELLPFMAALFLAGTCMVGAVLTPVITALRGAMLGTLISYIYVHNSLAGIVFNLLIITPSAVISSLALILSARESFGFSLSLARLALPGVQSGMLEQDFKLYCMRQLFVLIFYAAAILLRTIMAISFVSFFKF